MVFEWPHPKIDEDWANSTAQWRKITPLTCQGLEGVSLSIHQTTATFMKVKLVDILADNKGLFVRCKQEKGLCFARLLSGCNWWKRDYLPLPDIDPGIEALFSP